MYYPICDSHCINLVEGWHRTSHGGLEPSDRYIVQTEPGLTNMGHQPLINGWLGTTNNVSSQALGEYHTLEQAIARCVEVAGRPLQAQELTPDERDFAVVWAGADAREAWDAGDWVNGDLPDTDNDAEAAPILEQEAAADGIVLVGLADCIAHLRAT